VKVETKTEVGTGSRWPPNQIVLFLQLQDKGSHRGLLHPGRLQHLIGVL
jgi:hypothetical protein